MRLDKYLSEYSPLTRSEAKKVIRSGQVRVGGEIVKKPEHKVDGDVMWNGNPVVAQEYQYIMLHKPAGIVSATTDRFDQTVIQWVRETQPVRAKGEDEPFFLHKDLFPMGRLDKDTEGLLILTDDGELSHRLLSPKKHVEKVYYVELEKKLCEDDAKILESGVDIGEEKLTKPAKLEMISEQSCYLTITEGKFHQVKRMFEAVGNRVVYLKRVKMGGLDLDEKLKKGQWRFLTEAEIEILLCCANASEWRLG